ncbi:MAG: aspartate-semialdehyde dehydrogenase [Candidatus Omnitrophota bacterium]
MKKYSVAVIGVGVVGIELIRCLKRRSFPLRSFRVFARSERDIVVDSTKYRVEAIDKAKFDGIDIALFAGTEGEKGASLTYAQQFIGKGAVVIDNGADFRLKPDVPLIVPEANRASISSHKGIIANPNCTTIQAVVALAGIYKNFGLEKIILTSFQATSGAGRGAVETLWEEVRDIVNNNSDKEYSSIDKKLDRDFKTFGNQIAFNVIPQIGSFQEDGYTSEEWKVVHETHKILSDDRIKISATCVRVPVFTSHSEAIYFQTKKDAQLAEIANILKSSQGVRFVDFPSYSLPLDVDGQDLVYVSRLRPDLSDQNSFWLWVVADNLLKGAALNAVQIAEELIKL